MSDKKKTPIVKRTVFNDEIAKSEVQRIRQEKVKDRPRPVPPPKKKK